jgi:hypothetical protein
MADFTCPVCRVDGGDCATSDGDTVKDNSVFGQVRRHQSNDIAWTNPACRKATCERVNGITELGERVRARSCCVADSNTVCHR